MVFDIRRTKNHLCPRNLVQRISRYSFTLKLESTTIAYRSQASNTNNTDTRDHCSRWTSNTRISYTDSLSTAWCNPKVYTDVWLPEQIPTRDISAHRLPRRRTFHHHHSLRLIPCNIHGFNSHGPSLRNVRSSSLPADRHDSLDVRDHCQFPPLLSHHGTL